MAAPWRCFDHGMPHPTPEPDDPECVQIGGRSMLFSDDVTEVCWVAQVRM